MLASVIYDRPDVGFTHALVQSIEPLRALGIGVQTLLLEGNCHVDDARNSVVAHFLESGCTDLVFLDGDVIWWPKDLVRVVQADGDIVGGVYPHRKEWAASNTEMPVRMIKGAVCPGIDGLLLVEGLPTGFMKIRRSVIEGLARDVVWAKVAGASGKMPILFERRLFDGVRMSGDIAFCLKAGASGFSIYAVPEMRLGHRAKVIVRDSLAAALRRRVGTNLSFVADEIKNGSNDPGLFDEAISVVGNPFGLSAGGLLTAVAMARKARGPILEAGSGLSSVLMAAANPDNCIWCLENDRQWGVETAKFARAADVSNIAIVSCDIRDGFYDVIDPIPDQFDLGLVDGPHRAIGDRRRFFGAYGQRCENLVVDDVDDPPYAEFVEDWAKSSEKSFHRLDDRTAIVMEAA